MSGSAAIRRFRLCRMLTACAIGVGLLFTAQAVSAGDAALRRLPFGAVRPAGWIKAQLDGDAAGGSLAYYHRCWMVQNRAYELRGHNPDKKDKQSDFWDGAAEGYWGLALLSSSSLADDAALKQRAADFVAAVLKTQDADGYLGIHDAAKRYTPSMIDRVGHIGFMLLGLLDYAEAYDRKDVRDAVERAVQCDMRHFNRGTTNLHAAGFMAMSYPAFLDALSQATGRRDYADYAAFIIENYNASGELDNPIYSDAKLANLLDAKRPFYAHACNTTGNLALPWIAACATGDAKYRQAGDNALGKFLRQASASGSLPGDEDTQGREPSPEIPIEFCTTSYLVENALIAGEKTGDGRWFDIAERALFNAGMGARLPDGTAHAYLKRDSEFTLEYPGIFHREQYSPAHEPFCCTLRMMSMMPAYVSHMFKVSPDGTALAAVCYGPASLATEVVGVKVRVEERTRYPFEGRIEFAVTPETPVAFDFEVRVPAWATSSSVVCAGATVEARRDRRIVRKTWNAGDTIRVDFEAPVEAVRWVNGEYVLKSGPLVFAADLGATRTVHDTFPSGHTIQEMSDGKLPIYGFTPKNPRLWGGSFDARTADKAFGFRRVAVKVAAPDRPWQQSPLVLRGRLNRMRGSTPVDLVPMGCTVLRRVTFPAGVVLSDPGRGRSTMQDERTSL